MPDPTLKEVTVGLGGSPADSLARAAACATSEQSSTAFPATVRQNHHAVLPDLVIGKTSAPHASRPYPVDPAAE